MREKNECWLTVTWQHCTLVSNLLMISGILFKKNMYLFKKYLVWITIKITISNTLFPIEGRHNRSCFKPNWLWKKIALSSSGSPYLHRPPASSKDGQGRHPLARSAPFSVRGGGCCYLGRGAATLFWGVVAFGVCATGFAERGKNTLFFIQYV